MVPGVGFGTTPSYTKPSMRTAAWVLAIAALAFALGVLAPLRQLSADTVPGRIGGAVLRCAGDWDLSHVYWVRAETSRDRHYYYMHHDEAGEDSSVFGPAPALVVAAALLDFGAGDALPDTTLRARERGAAAVLLAIAAALIALAAAAKVTPARAALCAAVCVLSFAGAASLGQGMWQATTALPWLCGALCALAWRERFPRLALGVPALALVAVMLRPTLAPLALGVGVAWLPCARSRRDWAIAAIAAVIAAAPLVVWNAIHLWSPLPIGQWSANAAASEHVFSPAGAAVGIAGLLVSPARGLAWFAPIAIVGGVLALRDRRYRVLGIALAGQLVLMAAFFKWHGGQAFGPRLYAEAMWMATWLALGTDLPVRRAVRVPALAVTVVVGQLGLWWYTPEQWEWRRKPEADPAALWDVVDSPIPAVLSSIGAAPLPVRGYDSPPTRGYICDGGELSELPLRR